MTEEFIEESTEDNTLASTSSAEGEQGSRSGDTASQQDKDHKTKQTRKKQNNAFNAALQSTAQRYAALNKSVQQMQMQLMQMDQQFDFITAEAAVAIDALETLKTSTEELLDTQKIELSRLQDELATGNYAGTELEALNQQIAVQEAQINKTQTFNDGYQQVIDNTIDTLNTAGQKLSDANAKLESLDQQIKEANGDPELLKSLEVERDTTQAVVNESQAAIDMAEKHAMFAQTYSIITPSIQNTTGNTVEIINAQAAVGNALLSMTEDANISAAELETLKRLSLEAGIDTTYINQLAQDISQTGITMTGADGTIYSGANAGDYLISQLEEQILQSQSDLDQLVTTVNEEGIAAGKPVNEDGLTEDAQTIQDVVEMKDYVVVDYNGEKHIVYRDENDSSHIYVMDGEERVYVNQMDEPDRTNAFLEFNGGTKDGKPYAGQKGQKTGDMDPADARQKDAAIIKLHNNKELTNRVQKADNKQSDAHQKLAQTKAEQENTTANTNLSLITNANDRGSSASSIDPDENQKTSLTAFTKAADPTTEPTPEEPKGPVVTVDNEVDTPLPTNTGQIA